MNEKILIIEDDVDLQSILGGRLKSKGYQVRSALDSCQGLRTAYQQHPDLVILDLMLPDIDGFTTCQRLRELSNVPVLMLTALSRPEDMLRGFTVGADDYMVKPFDVRVLEARIAALIKRGAVQGEEHAFDDGYLRIDLESRQVLREGAPLHLTHKEFSLLKALITRKGCVLSHAELLEEVWGEAYTQDDASLTIYIRYLREKIEPDPSNPKYIRTEWGHGYWFEAGD